MENHLIKKEKGTLELERISLLLYQENKNKLSMKKVIYTLFLAATAGTVSAQMVSGTSIYVSEGAVMSIGQNFENKGTFENKGEIHFKSDIKNAGQMKSEGALVLDGFEKQNIGSESELTFNKVVLENNVDLNTALVINEELQYNNGILKSTEQNPLVFAANAKHINASDYSHSVGLVKKMDANNFEFPVGDGANYKGFTADGSNGTLAAEFRAQATEKVSNAYAPGVDYINDTEYWILKGENSNQDAKVTLGQNQGMSNVAYLKRGAWTISEDARFNGKSGLATGVVFTNGQGKAIRKDIGVWPNPTQGEFNLKLSGMVDTDELLVDITNQDGRVVMATKGKVSELRKVYNLPSSLVTTELTVRVVNGDEVLTEKLILNK